MQWQLIHAGDPIRGQADFVQMSGQGDLLLHIGDQFMPPQHWTFESGSWERRLVVDHPTPAFRPAFAYDSARGVLVRFGGTDENLQAIDETWEYDGQDWVRRTDVGAPPARFRSAMAYDSQRNVIVLFSGLDNSLSPLIDMWEYDGTGWTQVSLGFPAPAPRFDHSMAYDAARQRLVMAFGENSGLLADTWEFDGANWIASPGLPPQPRAGASMAYDETRQRVVAFGGEFVVGDTLFWSGTQWVAIPTPVAPEPRRDAGLAFDTSSARLLLYGGNGDFANSDLGDLWAFDGTAWVDITPPNSAPRSRQAAGMSFDETTGSAIVFGGFSCCGPHYPDETWRWTGTQWLEDSPPTSPVARTGHGMTFDADRATTIAFAGVTETDFLDETWEYRADTQTWQELFPTNVPASRIDAPMIYVPGHSGVLLFGGDSTGGDLGDTWVFQNGNWTEQLPLASPSPRHGSAMSYDSWRQRVVLFGGRSQGSLSGETWEYDGTTWLQSAASGPGARSVSSLVFDESRGTSVLVAGRRATFDALTWEYDGTSWTSRSTQYNPDMNRESASAVWDGQHEVILLFGGEARGLGEYNDLWAYGSDEDDDSIVGNYDNCRTTPNSDQSNDDQDARGNVCDCAPADPGSHSIPPSVASLAVSPETPTSISWLSLSSDAGSDTLYDVITGTLTQLDGFVDATCLANDLSDPMHDDSRAPSSPGDGYWYLSRGKNICGAGSFGRASLDGASVCPN